MKKKLLEFFMVDCKLFYRRKVVKSFINIILYSSY